METIEREGNKWRWVLELTLLSCDRQKLESMRIRTWKSCNGPVIQQVKGADTKWDFLLRSNQEGGLVLL